MGVGGAQRESLGLCGGSVVLSGGQWDSVGVSAQCIYTHQETLLASSADKHIRNWYNVLKQPLLPITITYCDWAVAK